MLADAGIRVDGPPCRPGQLEDVARWLEGQGWRVLAAILALIAALMGTDLFLDLASGASFSHLVLESFVLLLACGGIAFLGLTAAVAMALDAFAE